MPYEHIRYDLQGEYIHTWLIAGPQAIPLEENTDLDTAARRLKVLAQYAERANISLDLPSEPVEPARPPEGEGVTGDTLRWRIVHCEEDHFINLSNATHRGHLRSWAYTGLESAEAQRVTLILTTTDFADMWVNGVHVHRQSAAAHDAIGASTSYMTEACDVELNTGINHIIVRFETLIPDPAPYLLAVRMIGTQGLNIALPTQISPIARRSRLESVFQAAYIKQYVFTRYEEVSITWPNKNEGVELPEGKTSLTMRVQTPSGHVYSESEREGAAGISLDLGQTYRFPDGLITARVMPRAREYYEGNMRVDRTLSFWSMDNEPYHEAPEGTLPERRRATLLSAARREADIYSEIAKMAVGWWKRLEMSTITETAQRVREQGRRADASELLGLIGMLARFGDNPSFPEDLKPVISDAIIHAIHQTPDGTTKEPESRAFLDSVCELLAGQMYPDIIFPASGESGAWHKAQGEASALSWMEIRATRGFDAWESDSAYAETILALAHLIDFTNSDPLWEMASVLLDKLLFLIGANSYKGVFGMPRGWTTTAAVLGGYMEETSAIAKLMWGLGVNNVHAAAPVSLALLENYELPVLLQAIATDTPETSWSQEHHGSNGGATTVHYKTPDFMLAAAHNHRPGESGKAEHIWQATLGPGATVFVNHPICTELSDAQRPNFWCGNGVLPRVTQWQDALIALYKLPGNDWMGFTHAYFPVHAFEEYTLREGWAFARVGNGYLALTANGGLGFSKIGHAAYRELRSEGLQNVWLCQMGRAALDGDFEVFQNKILSLPVTYKMSDESCAPGVQWTTLRGDELELTWKGPFLKNGEPVSLDPDHHIANPYCTAAFPADALDIGYKGTVMRLVFRNDRA